ncbi:MAG: hypothetical protein ACM3SY_02605 [Candidatus Omnitrophota bacterium]
MKRIAIILISLSLLPFFIFAKKLGNLSEVTKPVNLKVDKDRLYVIDERIKIYLYSLKSFKYVTSLLKKGEGPGECRSAPYCTIYPDCLSLFSIGKIMSISKKLDYKEEFRIKRLSLRYVFPVGKNFVGYGWGINEKTGRYSTDISIYTRDKDLKYKKLVYYAENSPITKPGQLEDYPMLPCSVDFIVYNDKVFVSDPYRGMFVTIFDSNGNELNRINVNFEKKKVSEEFKKHWMDERWPDKAQWETYKKRVNAYFQEYYPPFFKFEVNNNKIYFFTYNRKGDLQEIVITDLKGKILKKSYVPRTRNKFGSDFTVDNDKYYYIVDNDEIEEWELHVVDIK